ncbi:MAG: hypothetical protein E6J02_00190 [Chloroflexi bacterium]|nr:MAG: hypothetical protein E6J02_00190 [Chloroflexota bacterium]
MKWVTRKNASVDRVACPWLITKRCMHGARRKSAKRAERWPRSPRPGSQSWDPAGSWFWTADGWQIPGLTRNCGYAAACKRPCTTASSASTRSPGMNRTAPVRPWRW